MDTMSGEPERMTDSLRLAIRALVTVVYDLPAHEDRIAYARQAGVRIARLVEGEHAAAREAAVLEAERAKLLETLK